MHKMKAYDKIDWHRVVRYVSGEYAPEDEADLRAWIAEDQRRAALASELRQVWNATERAPAERDVDAAWTAVNEQLYSEKPAHQEPFARQSHRAKRPPKRGLRRSAGSWYSVSAGALIIAAIAFIAVSLYDNSFTKTATQEAKVFTTEKGQRATIRLADGSRVRLNVDSKLTLPPDFADSTREVMLEGEAYFDVARDVARPFIVKAGEASVRVLGTSFNVEAYAGEERVQVAVAEGEVALKADESERQDTVVLRPRQLGVASGRHLQAVRHGVDLLRYVAWTKGKLVFTDAPFEEVRRKLSRWYDLQVEMQGPPGTVDRLNATFDNAPLSQILKAVGAALDLEYSYDRSEGIVTFYRSGGEEASSSKA